MESPGIGGVLARQADILAPRRATAFIFQGDASLANKTALSR